MSNCSMCGGLLQNPHHTFCGECKRERNRQRCQAYRRKHGQLERVPTDTITDLIRRKAATRGMEVRDYARSVFSPSTYRNFCRWEQGQRATISTLDEICCSLGHHLSEFWDGYFEEATDG